MYRRPQFKSTSYIILFFAVFALAFFNIDTGNTTGLGTGSVYASDGTVEKGSVFKSFLDDIVDFAEDAADEIGDFIDDVEDEIEENLDEAEQNDSKNAVDDYVWVLNEGGGAVTRIKKSDQSAAVVTVGKGAGMMAVDSDSVWVANTDDGTVTRIKKSDLSTSVLSAGQKPTDIAVDKKYLWVSNFGPGAVTRINKSNGDSKTVSAGGGTGISVGPEYVWVSNQNGFTVTRIKKSDFVRKPGDQRRKRRGGHRSGRRVRLGRAPTG